MSLVLAAAILVSCGDRVVESQAEPAGSPSELKGSGGLKVEDLPERTKAPSAETLFSRLPSSVTGMAFQNTIDLSNPLKRLYQSGFSCGGVAIGDLDGD
ncbi:MAG: hypothetical protein AAF514_24295, partial [Verrucomicrobiota bacterium]